MRGQRVRMLTVRGPAGRTDVVAAADASLVHLIPLLVEQVGGGELDPANRRWALYDDAGRPLSTATLVEQGVADGDLLVLSCTGPPADQQAGSSGEEPVSEHDGGQTHDQEIAS